MHVYRGRFVKVKRYETYYGPYRVVPKISEPQTLSTIGLAMNSNITVAQIPYHEESNEANGTTVYIGESVF